MTTFQRPSITLAAAQRMVQAALLEAEGRAMHIAVVVVDESGRLKAFARMDAAPLVATDAARKKAVTAVGFGLETGPPWHDFIKGDPILAGGAPQLKDFILLGGGIPVVVDGAICGAIGVAGGHYEQDTACARAGISALS